MKSMSRAPVRENSAGTRLALFRQDELPQDQHVYARSEEDANSVPWTAHDRLLEAVEGRVDEHGLATGLAERAKQRMKAWRCLRFHGMNSYGRTRFGKYVAEAFAISWNSVTLHER